MKNLIKELCKREAGKSEVSVGNVRSIMKHLSNILADPNYNSLGLEFINYLSKDAEKMHSRHCWITFNYNYGKSISKKKKARMKKAKGK